ncbi:helix-turn-helix transcriptional regulator [Vibrio vulnificus]|uniref:helix-turn-helix transcriptional regulator n=1 Tax=Vibrio vulnificus TaxID=672 RepID=UPI001029E855|nr:helix-turn-helix transcriptional regulator [Vibrio vulnificus]EGR7974493.1 helix-turn-helix transcriptional regulator [Vibrio vulnificus]ELS0750849.1 helix-turn-helix transcriptional regulator [Vibrio vulnificus]MCA3908189.1 helix-turn-helix transcriptional regulator [Vibrio vulnificus]MCU8110932.1 helix-turn-helix transcriptional regulator [Vibrio vulnificus]RZP87407.1 AraC family transcriptional regulator [Vibrio vulnificus]
MSRLNITKSKYNQLVIDALSQYATQLDSTQIQATESLSPPLTAEKLYSHLNSMAKLFPDKPVGFEIGQQLLKQDLKDKMIKDVNLITLTEQCNVLMKQSNYMTAIQINIFSARMVIKFQRSLSIRYSSETVDNLLLGYFVGFLQYCAGSRFTASSIIVHSVNPINVLKEFDSLIHSASHNKDLSLNFPISWVLENSQEEDSDLGSIIGLESIRQVCRHNLSDPNWSLTRLAHHFHISVRHLQRTIQSHGTTFRQLMTEERLEKIKVMIVNHLPQQEICIQTAFASPSSLGRFFKQQMGETLRQYQVKTCGSS